MNLHIVTISYSVNILNVKIKLGMDISYTLIMNDYKYIYFFPCLACLLTADSLIHIYPLLNDIIWGVFKYFLKFNFPCLHAQ